MFWQCTLNFQKYLMARFVETDDVLINFRKDRCKNGDQI